MNLVEFKKIMQNNGFDINDVRLNIKKIEEDVNNQLLSETEIIKGLIEKNNLVKKIIQGNLIISNWLDFVNDIIAIYNKLVNNDNGDVASYIPQLANVDPNLFAICICTIDGQILQLGNYETPFSVQSCSKPIIYGIAVDSNNEKYVHQFVGRESSGRNFNELCLNHENIPHNPLINSGAIVVSSLIIPNHKQSDRFDFIMNYWRKLVAGKVNFNNCIYLSEKETADRNFCLGYMMQEKKTFSHGNSKEQLRKWKTTDLRKNLEFYFQNCSIECNTIDLARLASTLANGGVNVFTNEKVFNPDNVKNILSLMYSCGMYDYSGEWSYLMGIPAKSGVSGSIYAVIPNVMGIAVYSPRLDSIGNSVRGIEFFKDFCNLYNVHRFDSLINVNSKKNLTRQIQYSNYFNIYM